MLWKAERLMRFGIWHRHVSRCVRVGLILGLAIITSPAVSEETAPGQAHTTPAIDLYVYVGFHTIWAGDRFRYTVYDSTVVEARINGMTGELILILPIGLQGPGQYTLPWDGTMHEGTVPFAGKYQLELFFGEEYAAKFWFLCKPRETPE